MHDTPIAIVGYAYRAPGVGRKNLWDYLAEAKSAWSTVPKDRFQHDSYYHTDKDKSGTFTSKGGHFLPGDIYAFDAPFFNLRAEEARSVDPQHRIIMECTLEAAENAGISLADLAGSNTGVFAAIGSPEYGHQVADDLPSTTTWAAAGCSPTMFANRLSYFFDLAGPSISLDAACASSSYAIHAACQSLRLGECEAAIIGGSSLLMGPNQWAFLDNMGALSAEGKCFSYDIKAQGFGRGEGAGAVIIKPLDAALKNGDPIQAVIRNSAANHVGRSEGITMPRQSAQEALLRSLHERVGLDPSDTPVIEGHGTGTQAGDPIEAGAFANVLAPRRTSENPLYIGSLKSNFGHLEAASGIVGLIKGIMMIQKGMVLPSAHFEEFNKNIVGRERLRIPNTPEPWPQNALKRVAVTNFGFGGSNAAVLIEEAPNQAVRQTRDVSNDSRKRLFVLSAKSESSLTAYSASFSKYLESQAQSAGTDFINNLSFTLGQRRTHFTHRLGFFANSLDSLKSQLSTAKASKVRDRTLAFVFTGQGAQHAKMASGLQNFEVFTSTLREAETILTEMGATWSLTKELGREESGSRVNDADISQPACTAVQIALVSLLKSWGIEPARVTGHSSGEIGAAYATGFLSFKTALAVAYFRGQAAAKLAKEQSQNGAMIALGVSPEAAEELIAQSNKGYSTVAAINSASAVTVSGDEAAIDEIKELADSQSIFARKLKVEVAYHSKHLEKVADYYLSSIQPYFESQSVAVNHSVIYVSSVLGQVASKNQVADAGY